MAQWRYEARRLNGDGTSTLIDPEVPLSDVGVTTVLSGPEGITGSISPAYTRLLGPDGNPMLQAYSTALYAVQDESIRAAGIITQVHAEGERLGVTATGFAGYPAKKPYDGDVFFIQVDPLDIVRHIWTYLQGRPRGNLGIALGATKVGKLIGTRLEQVEFDTQSGPVSFEAGPFKLNWWETSDLGSVIDDLAKAHGFDYHESHQRGADGDQVLSRIDFAVPRFGTRRNDLRFVEGENVIVRPPATSNSEQYADVVYVRGAGEGRAMVRGMAVRSGEQRLASPVVIEDSSLKSVRDCNARAKEELDRRTGGMSLSEIAVLDTPSQSAGSASNGDEIEIHTMGEWGPQSAFYRIVSTTISPADLSVTRFSLMRADMISA